MLVVFDSSLGRSGTGCLVVSDLLQMFTEYDCIINVIIPPRNRILSAFLRQGFHGNLESS